MADDADIGAYFERIGFAGSMAPTLQTLQQLHLLHVAVIPYENLDPLMGVPVRLDLPNLQQKLLFDRRGGYALEHNLLFRAVLQSLDFTVKPLGASTLAGAGVDPQAQHLADHLPLLVEVAGVPYLADPGFGTLTPTVPLKLRAEVEQQTPHERFRLLGGDPEWTLEAERHGGWQHLYRFGLAEIGPEALSAMNDAAAGSARQRDELTVSRAEKGRRLWLRNFTLGNMPPGGPSETRELDSVAEVKEVLAGTFGLQLPADERLLPVLTRIDERLQAEGAI